MGRNLSTVPYVQEGQAVSAAWANQLVRELRNQPAYHAQMQIPKPPDFKPPCAFGYVYGDGEFTYLQGGVVSGGSSNKVVDRITLTETGESESDDVFVCLKVTAKANKFDGVLFPGVDEIPTVTIHTGDAIPDNTIPTASAPNGILYIPLGIYRDKVFLPYACGNYSINHCPGSLTYTRDTLYG